MSDETGTGTNTRTKRTPTPAVRVTGEVPAATTGQTPPVHTVPISEEEILADVIRELLRLATDLGYEPAQNGVNLADLEISHMRIDSAARAQTQAGRLARLLKQRRSLIVDA